MADRIAGLWLTIPEMDGLPSLPGTARGKLKASLRQRWTSRPRAKGKGLEYLATSLPPETQAALRERAEREEHLASLARIEASIAAIPVPEPFPAPEPGPLEVWKQRQRHKAETHAKFVALAPDSPKRRRAEAREWCVCLYKEIYRDHLPRIQKQAARQVLCDQINDGSRVIPAAYREDIPPLYKGRRLMDEVTLERWVTAYDADGLWGLTDGYGGR